MGSCRLHNEFRRQNCSVSNSSNRVTELERAGDRVDNSDSLCCLEEIVESIQIGDTILREGNHAVSSVVKEATYEQMVNFAQESSSAYISKGKSSRSNRRIPSESLEDVETFETTSESKRGWKTISRKKNKRKSTHTTPTSSTRNKNQICNTQPLLLA